MPIKDLINKGQWPSNDPSFGIGDDRDPTFGDNALLILPSENDAFPKDMSKLIAGKTITAFNGLTTSTTQRRFGARSLRFVRASSQYATITPFEDFAFGLDDFSIEYWFYLTTSGVEQYLFNTGTATGNYGLRVLADNRVGFICIGGTNVNTVGIVTTSAWNVAMLSRQSGRFYLILNGKLENASTQALNLTASNFYLGTKDGTTSFLDGYVDGVREVRGRALWTTDFPLKALPPTNPPPTNPPPTNPPPTNPPPTTPPGNPPPTNPPPPAANTYFADGFESNSFVSWSSVDALDLNRGPGSTYNYITTAAAAGIPASEGTYVARFERPAAVTDRPYARVSKKWSNTGQERDWQGRILTPLPDSSSSGIYRAKVYIPVGYTANATEWTKIVSFGEEGTYSGVFRSDLSWWLNLAPSGAVGGSGTVPVLFVNNFSSNYSISNPPTRNAPLGRWFEIRADLFEGDKINWYIDGTFFATTLHSTYPVGRFYPSSTAWSWNVGHDGGTGVIFVDDVSYMKPGSVVAPTTPPPTTNPPPPTTNYIPKEQRPFASTSAWNVPVTSLPVHANSSTLVSSLWNNAPFGVGNFDLNNQNFSFGIWYAEEALKNYTFTVPVIGNTVTVPWNKNWLLPSGEQKGTILDRSNGRSWDLFQISYNSGSDTLSANGATAMTSVRYDTYSGINNQSRGSGIAFQAMLLRPWEVKAGQIQHALCLPIINTASTFVAPATKSDGSTSGSGPSQTAWPIIPSGITNHIYVSAGGSDSNAGTQTAPYRTIQKAASLASAGTYVHVAPGTYAENIVQTVNGTSTNPIIFVSDTLQGARIVQPAGGSRDTAIDSRGHYVQWLGFDVDGSTYSSGTRWRIGIYITGTNARAAWNKVHDLQRQSGGNTVSGAAIYGDYFYGNLNQIVEYNTVYNIGPDGTTSSNLQGIYMSGTGTVSGNVCWKCVGAAVHGWHAARSLNVYNNTVDESRIAYFVGFSSGETYNGFAGPANNCVFRNNIASNCDYGFLENGSTASNTYAYNVTYNCGTNYSLLGGNTFSNNLTTDPQYLNRTSRDYRLQSTSPCVNSGIATGAPPSLDQQRYSRPQNTSYDRGAFEYATTSAAGIPMGTRFALNVTDAEIESWIASLPSNLPASYDNAARAIARALRQYGFFVTDTGGAANFELESLATAPEATWADAGLPTMTGSNGKSYPRDLLDGLLSQSRLYAVVPSDQYGTLPPPTNPPPTNPPPTNPPPTNPPPTNPPPTVATGWRTLGPNILDGAGNPIQLTGVNVTGLSGPTFLLNGESIRGYKAQLQQVKDLGFNVIRLPFSYAMVGATNRVTSGINSSSSELLNLTPIEIMDKILDHCDRIGLYVILDHHRTNIGGSFANEWGMQGNGLWYETRSGAPIRNTSAQVTQMWVTIATRYKNRMCIVGYDLHNEPGGQPSENPAQGAVWGNTSGSGHDWPTWCETTGNAILDVDPNHLIIVEGIEYAPGGASISTWYNPGANLSSAKTRPITLKVPNKLVYSAHPYGPELAGNFHMFDPANGFPDNLPTVWENYWSYLFWNGTAPVIVGEFGARLDEADSRVKVYSDRLLKYMSGVRNPANNTNVLPSNWRGISWTRWEWCDYSGDTGGIVQTSDFATVNQTRYQQLAPYLYKGTIVKPNPGSVVSPPPTNPPPTNPPPTNPPPTTPPTTPPPPTSQTYGGFYTNGNQIIDGSGSAIRLTGGNWNGAEWAGISSGLRNGLLPGGCTSIDMLTLMTRMKNLGFNCIRYCFSQSTITMQNTRHVTWAESANPWIIGKTPLQVMDQIMKYAAQVELYVILDHHRNDAFSGAGTQTGGLLQDGWTEAEVTNNLVNLAKRYIGNPYILGMDVHNEPNGTGVTWGQGGQDWPSYAERLGNAILAVNPNWLIFVEGTEYYQGQAAWWGGNLRGARTRPIRLNVPNKLVYAPHSYGPSLYNFSWFGAPTSSTTINTTTFYQHLDDTWGYLHRDGTAPCLVGEFGGWFDGRVPSDLPWIRAFHQYMNQYNIHWTMWTLMPTGGDTGGIFDASYNTQNVRYNEYSPHLFRTRIVPPRLTNAAGQQILAANTRTPLAVDTNTTFIGTSTQNWNDMV